MNDKFTDEYLNQLQLMHETTSAWGAGAGVRSIYPIAKFVEKYNMVGADVIDYGCGKGGISRTFMGTINVINYDPAIPKFSKVPKPCPYLICMDVMEHVEMECVDTVLQHTAELTQKRALFFIDLQPAKHHLPDGRNAHITQLPPMQWINLLDKYYDIQYCQNNGLVLEYIGAPRRQYTSLVRRPLTKTWKK